MEPSTMPDNKADKSSQANQTPNDKAPAIETSASSTTEKDSASSATAKTASSAEKEKSVATKPETSKPSTSKATTATAKTSNTKVKPEKSAKPSNTLSLIAVAVAVTSILASAGHYFWQQQVTSNQLALMAKENQQAIKQSQAQLKRSLSTEFNQKLQQQLQSADLVHQQASVTSESKLKQISTEIAKLHQQVNQRQPSDWLVHEAEYLIRIAARTMWLERDTTAAIGLLRDADNRLKSLNEAKFLPVRALINEDIEHLSLMPKLENEEAVLTLMALNKHVPTLILSGVNFTEALDETTEDFALSEDVSDWQTNLRKTWDKFIGDFITVRRRTGMVEPLMAPEQQEHLKQNLSLKVQLAQWAASEQKEAIYQQTLLDIEQWLAEFFDMELEVNQNFAKALADLKSKTIYYDYPSNLKSLKTMKRLLQDSQQVTAPKANSEKVNKDKAGLNKTSGNAQIVPKNGDQL